LPRLGDQHLGTITKLDVEAWVASVTADGIGAATINTAHRLLRTILSKAEQADMIVKNPARLVKTPRAGSEEMRFLGLDELARIADAVPDRDRALVLLLGLGGFRIGEATALRVEDLDLLRRTVG
jgi:integrase